MLKNKINTGLSGHCQRMGWGCPLDNERPLDVDAGGGWGITTDRQAPPRTRLFDQRPPPVNFRSVAAPRWSVLRFVGGIRSVPSSAAMDACCSATVRQQQRYVLQLVLAINATMFCVEFGAGLFARSTALLGDSLDMLGDTLVYAFSLYVLNKNRAWRARSALIKGIIMLAFGAGVFVDATLKVEASVLPVVPAMVGIGALALMANTVCFALLWRHRASDLNLRSTWLCSRNDLVANGAVIVAALLVAELQSVWPDVLIGVGIAGLFVWTALGVLQEAVPELRQAQRTDA